jgi:hypothetical protein
MLYFWFLILLVRIFLFLLLDRSDSLVASPRSAAAPPTTNA